MPIYDNVETFYLLVFVSILPIFLQYICPKECVISD